MAVERDLDVEPGEALRDPTATAKRVDPFETWDDVEAVAEEVGDHYGPAVVFAAATGLRPAEWVGLEWRNVAREHRVVYVEQAVVGGERTRTKTKNSLRAVPLTDEALAALDSVSAARPLDAVRLHDEDRPPDRPARLATPSLESRGRSLRQGLSTFEVAR